MIKTAFLLAVIGLAGRGFVEAQDRVHVEEVDGQVLYGAGAANATTEVTAGQELGPGTFSAGNNGTVFLSSFNGSFLRLAETGKLRYLGTSQPGPANPAAGAEHSFELQQGKLRVDAKVQPAPAQRYSIQVPRDRVSSNGGSCVICMHGEGTYIYVARGHVQVTPSHSAAGSPASQQLDANGSVGTLDSRGELRVRPLSTVASATQNCLLEGLAPDESGGAAGHKPVDASGPIVSPTQ